MRFKLPTRQFNNRQTAWAAFAFAAFVFTFESYKLNINYSDYFILLYDTQETLIIGVTVVFLILSLLVFYFFTLTAFSSKGRFKFIYFVLFALASIVEYGYQKALGRFFNILDFETILATTSEQKTESIFLYANFWLIIPCTIFLACLFLVKNKEPKGLKSLVKTFSGVGGFFIFLLLFSGLFADKNFPSVTFNTFYRTNIEFLLNGALTGGKLSSTISGKELTRRKIKKPDLPENYRPSNNIVLVIDESVRGDHLSINGYQRKTTPFLENLARQKTFHNWGIVSAASTGSRFSYNSIITGLMPDDFPDQTEFKVKNFPTIFQYAKAMNYKTFFFDGQMRNFWSGIPDDQNYIDLWQNVTAFNGAGLYEKWEVDNNIAAKINEVISNSTGNLIVVFKHGSHIPYQDNFPPEQTIWQPSFVTNKADGIPSADQLEAVRNAYDNSIKYNVDSFFEKMVNDYQNLPNNTFIIYTGDHGQTLFTNGKASHGGKTVGEANVPLFIIGNFENDLDTKYKASHCNIFPTILDLLNYPQELRETRNYLSLLKMTAKDSRQRFFNPDLGNKVPFD